MKVQKKKFRASGFTFVELCIGLVITMLIMGGVAAIMTSVGQGWEQGQSTQAMQLQSNQVYARLQKALAGAKYVGQYTAGSVTNGAASPASIFFWKTDGYPDGNTSDGIVQTGEMALIQQDPTTHSLFLYQAIPFSQMSASQLSRAGTVLHDSDLTNGSSPAQFKALDFVTSQALGGPGNQTDIGNLHVDAAQFYVQGMDSTQQLPIIEFALSFSRNGEQTKMYGSTTMRGPTTQPN